MNTRGDYALSFARRKKAQPITEAALMAALNIHVNYSFRSTVARRAGSLLVRLWQYWFSRLPQEPSRAPATRGAATLYRRLKPPCDVPMNWRQYLSSAPEWNISEIYFFEALSCESRQMNRVRLAASPPICPTCPFVGISLRYQL